GGQRRRVGQGLGAVGPGAVVLGMQGGVVFVVAVFTGIGAGIGPRGRRQGREQGEGKRRERAHRGNRCGHGNSVTLWRGAAARKTGGGSSAEQGRAAAAQAEGAEGIGEAGRR